MNVIWWRYVDGSGQGIIATVRDKMVAEKLYQLLKEHGDQAKMYTFEVVPHFGQEEYP